MCYELKVVVFLVCVRLLWSAIIYSLSYEGE